MRNDALERRVRHPVRRAHVADVRPGEGWMNTVTASDCIPAPPRRSLLRRGHRAHLDHGPLTAGDDHRTVGLDARRTRRRRCRCPLSGIPGAPNPPLEARLTPRKTCYNSAARSHQGRLARRVATRADRHRHVATCGHDDDRALRPAGRTGSEADRRAAPRAVPRGRHRGRAWNDEESAEVIHQGRALDGTGRERARWKSGQP